MVCELYKYKKEVAVSFIGKSGTEYPKNEYNNLGRGGPKDLPLADYPYKVKYDVYPVWSRCNNCLCNKDN